MLVLVTGGAGYIGSHTVVLLQEAGHDVVVFDNLCNAHPEVFNRITRITGQQAAFVEGDIRDKAALDRVFDQFDIDAVLHFAGLKVVGESISKPIDYYKNNVDGSLNLFESMLEHGCNKLVFSSSANVYGDPETFPVKEDFPLGPFNPYGQTKLMVEKILMDICHANPSFEVAILRYFNPVGAHPSGLIGEDPNDVPNNLMPFIAQVAAGKREYLSVFGGDYPTIDGTGIRDYIHVVDLAQGHLSAMDNLSPKHGCEIYNLGTGNGYSVLQAVEAFAQVSGRDIPYKIVDRRPGDIAISYADPTKSHEKLGWKAQSGIDQMVEDHWRWQSQNPEGYES
jgi:UDP-glucose 4-epimerase